MERKIISTLLALILVATVVFFGSCKNNAEVKETTDIPTATNTPEESTTEGITTEEITSDMSSIPDEEDETSPEDTLAESRKRHFDSFEEMRQYIMRHFALGSHDASYYAGVTHDEAFTKYSMELDLTECLDMDLTEQYDHYKQKGFREESTRGFRVYLYTGDGVGISAGVDDYGVYTVSIPELSNYENLRFREWSYQLSIKDCLIIEVSCTSACSMDDFRNIVQILSERGDVLFIFCYSYDYEFINTGMEVHAWQA